MWIIPDEDFRDLVSPHRGVASIRHTHFPNRNPELEGLRKNSKLHFGSGEFGSNNPDYPPNMFFKLTEFKGIQSGSRYITNLNVWHPSIKGRYIPFKFIETESDTQLNLLKVGPQSELCIDWGDGDNGGAYVDLDIHGLKTLFTKDQDEILAYLGQSKFDENHVYDLIASIIYFVWLQEDWDSPTGLLPLWANVKQKPQDQE